MKVDTELCVWLAGPEHAFSGDGEIQRPGRWYVVHNASKMKRATRRLEAYGAGLERHLSGLW